MNFSFDVLSQISNGDNMFSKAESKLAEYILSDPHLVLTLSITELAENCNVSLATVSRFCRRLSLNGYPEFRLELMKSLSSLQSIDLNSQQGITLNDSISEVISKVNAIHQQSLSRSMAALDPAQVSKAVDLLVQANDVYFLGSGNMMLIAMNAKLQFMQISTKFHADPDPAIQAIGASLLTERSVCVIFSYSGATRDIIEVAKIAKEHKAKIVSITRYEQSPLVDLSDIVLICGVSEGPFQMGSASTQIGLLYVIDVLYTEYFRRTSDESQRSKEKSSIAVVGKIRSYKAPRKKK